MCFILEGAALHKAPVKAPVLPLESWTTRGSYILSLVLLLLPLLGHRRLLGRGVEEEKQRFEEAIRRVSSALSGFQVKGGKGELPPQSGFGGKSGHLVSVKVGDSFLLEQGSDTIPPVSISQSLQTRLFDKNNNELHRVCSVLTLNKYYLAKTKLS